MVCIDNLLVGWLIGIIEFATACSIGFPSNLGLVTAHYGIYIQ